MKKSKTYLIITSSGGGGHLQAANAIEQEILSREQDIKIIKKDFLMDWVGFPFGNFSSSAWKFAQIYQFIYFQKIFAKLQRYAEIIFSPFVFIKLLKLLCKEEISFIYDTQCLTTRAIVLAIKIYNTKKNKDLKIQKIITDLPIKTSSHFFRSIKKLSD
ncbi:MAG: hypothetical protein A3F40_02870 [Chlamydiae bacterium RIFCSPHIGHO2_12_FULL_27_8]|nr:MAG: hypothetical protein A3F40_02870 [Chlamydiae bacterium RIFCSPHIGHO2_12_FULL_27_8]